MFGVAEMATVFCVLGSYVPCDIAAARQQGPSCVNVMRLLTARIQPAMTFKQPPLTLVLDRTALGHMFHHTAITATAAGDSSSHMLPHPKCILCCQTRMLGWTLYHSHKVSPPKCKVIDPLHDAKLPNTESFQAGQPGIILGFSSD